MVRSLVTEKKEPSKKDKGPFLKQSIINKYTLFLNLLHRLSKTLNSFRKTHKYSQFEFLLKGCAIYAPFMVDYIYELIVT